SLQPRSTLMKRAAMVDQADAVVVAESQWKEWIVARLNEAQAAVIDVSVMSASVQWEVETAGNIIGDDRLLLIGSRGPCTPSSLDGRMILMYGDSTLEMKKARHAVAEWFQRRFQDVEGA